VYTCITGSGCGFMYAHGGSSLNGQILATLGVTNPFAPGNDAGNGLGFDYEASLDRAADADFFVIYYQADTNAGYIASDSRYLNFKGIREGNWITGTIDNFNECGAVTYVRVDILIRDY